MAIYHLSVKPVKRSDGRSAVSSAAYRAGERMYDDRRGRTYDYSERKDVKSWIQAPEWSPGWVRDRERLWNEVEASDRRKDARPAREVELALPVELGRDEQDELLKGYVAEQFVARGMIADVSVHRDHEHNPHAHVLLTTREIGPGGFGSKPQEWNDRSVVVEWRQAWSEHANRELERAGFDERIDHRTLEAQGIDREPGVHLGPDVQQMGSRGIRTERGDHNRGVQERNAEREWQAREDAWWDATIERAVEESERLDRELREEKRMAWWGREGVSAGSARWLVQDEREMEREYSSVSEARRSLAGSLADFDREGRELQTQDRELDRLASLFGQRQEAQGVLGRGEGTAGALRRMVSREAREERERAVSLVERADRELMSAGIGGVRDLEERRRRVQVRLQEHQQEGRDWEPVRGVLRELEGIERQRDQEREVRARAEREAAKERERPMGMRDRALERIDRLRGEESGTARGRDDDWVPGF